MKTLLALGLLALLLATQAAATGPRLLTPDDLRAAQEMRNAAKASGDPGFLGDPGFYLTDSDHSSASNPIDGAACFDERYMSFLYALRAPLNRLGANTSINMRHRLVRGDAPPFCVDLLGNLTAREDLWDATSYLNVDTCFSLVGGVLVTTPEHCTFHAWVPIPGAPPITPVLPPESKPRPWYCPAYAGYLNEHGVPIFGCD